MILNNFLNLSLFEEHPLLAIEQKRTAPISKIMLYLQQVMGYCFMLCNILISHNPTARKFHVLQVVMSALFLYYSMKGVLFARYPYKEKCVRAGSGPSMP